VPDAVVGKGIEDDWSQHESVLLVYGREKEREVHRYCSSGPLRRSFLARQICRYPRTLLASRDSSNAPSQPRFQSLLRRRAVRSILLRACVLPCDKPMMPYTLRPRGLRSFDSVSKMFRRYQEIVLGADSMSSYSAFRSRPCCCKRLPCKVSCLSPSSARLSRSAPRTSSISSSLHSRVASHRGVCDLSASNPWLAGERVGLVIDPK